MSLVILEGSAHLFPRLEVHMLIVSEGTNVIPTLLSKRRIPRKNAGLLPCWGITKLN